MAFFKRHYGASPLHVLAHLAAMALIYIPLSYVWQLNPTHHLNYIFWIVTGAILHDALFLPVYVILDLIARVGIGDHAMRPVRFINHIRFPVVMSGAAFLVYFPLILGDGRENYIKDLGHAPPNYALRWAILTAALFTASAIVYAVRLRRNAVPRTVAPVTA